MAITRSCFWIESQFSSILQDQDKVYALAKEHHFDFLY